MKGTFQISPFSSQFQSRGCTQIRFIHYSAYAFWLLSNVTGVQVRIPFMTPSILGLRCPGYVNAPKVQDEQTVIGFGNASSAPSYP